MNATWSTLLPGYINTTPVSNPQINKTMGPIIFPFDVNAFKMFMTIIYGIIFMVGMPGNSLVILTIIRVRKMRTVKNLFIGNLAIGDLVTIVWCLPTSLVSLYISWPYGEIVCKYIFPMADVIIGNTIFTMVSISLDRYRAIVYPFTAKPSLRRMILILILMWVISYVLIGLPLVIATKVSRGYWVKRSCNLEWKGQLHEITYRLATCAFLFCVPFSIVLYCFLRIKEKLLENIRFASSSVRGRSTFQRAKKNQKLIKMLLVIFLCFTVCFLPINILLLTITFHRDLIRWKYVGIAFQIAVAFLFSNSIMNPIILYCLSNDYKRAYLRQLTCLCPNTAFQNVRDFSFLSSIRRTSNSTTRSRTSTCDAHAHNKTNETAEKWKENNDSQNLLFKETRVDGYNGANVSFSRSRKSVTWCKHDDDHGTTVLINEY